MKKGLLCVILLIALILSACTGHNDHQGESGTAGDAAAGSTTSTANSSATEGSGGPSDSKNTSTTTTIEIAENTIDAAELFGSTTTVKGSTAASVTTTTTLKPAEPTQVASILLPKTGYDPDGKGVIQVGKVSVSGQTVSLELKNVSTKWISEETSNLEYTCYAKDGRELKKDTVFFGAINVGASRTCTLSFPTGTTEIKITKFTAPYWSQWKK